MNKINELLYRVLSFGLKKPEVKNETPSATVICKFSEDEYDNRIVVAYLHEVPDGTIVISESMFWMEAMQTAQRMATKEGYRIIPLGVAEEMYNDN